MMGWSEIRQALGQMVHHKLRTGLTLLGMIFGVGAVIAMLSIGEGAEREALSMIESMGLRNVVVESRPSEGEARKSVREHSVGLSLGDVHSALDTLTFIDDWSAEKQVRVFTLFSRHGRSDARVSGVTPSHFGLASMNLENGRFFTEAEDRHYRQVAVLGPEAAQGLFPSGEAIGQRIKVNHQWFEVVGVLADKGQQKSKIEGVKLGGERNQVFIPLLTALKKLAFKPLDDQLDAVKLQLGPGIDAPLAAASIDHLLSRRHGGEFDYQVVVPADLLAQYQQTQRIFNIVMACVAGISLLVGGIGIMNIMLATVMERTTEIGLLRALGATKADIARQFIIESLVIAASGGLIGIVAGMLLSLVIGAYADWQVAWSAYSLLLSVGVCMIIGVLFGWYPAKKAAGLDPIVALQRD
ncbi:ABC transporter permease [Ferrimonas sp. SCSIO 43195]|uniref:ABC transporter permease n=1 Tax=Ferrimonas sp. SCSIO 43195 TaxID=2822844 RepID=UPI002075C543|nr:ABC transporter permease [Ferrimonas sp. SCSIO 43195]USD36012.1 ABC transporter permease [Ferrimonas sp. SCSIO 43195]